MMSTTANNPHPTPSSQRRMAGLAAAAWTVAQWVRLRQQARRAGNREREAQATFWITDLKTRARRFA